MQIQLMELVWVRRRRVLVRRQQERWEQLEQPIISSCSFHTESANLQEQLPRPDDPFPRHLGYLPISSATLHLQTREGHTVIKYSTARSGLL